MEYCGVGSVINWCAGSRNRSELKLRKDRCYGSGSYLCQEWNIVVSGVNL